MLVMVLLNERDTQMFFLSGVTSSSGMHGWPRNSNTMRWPTTPQCSRTRLGSASRNFRVVVMPSLSSRRIVPRATPHRSPRLTRPSATSIACGDLSTQTPSGLPGVGSRLAMWLASLASVFVGAMPTPTGMPVHCKAWRRRRVPQCMSRRAGRLPSVRNASSML